MLMAIERVSDSIRLNLLDMERCEIIDDAGSRNYAFVCEIQEF